VRRASGYGAAMSVSIRPAAPADIDLIAELIRALAEYERLSGEVRFEPDELARHLFGPRPHAEVAIGEVDGRPEGFALYFHSFSTFEGRPGIYLEDLFVRPAARGQGLGKALLSHLAAVAVERGCARLEWAVLDWNEPAIGFYRSVGAAALEDWTTMRVSGSALARLAEKGAKPAEMR